VEKWPLASASTSISPTSAASASTPAPTFSHGASRTPAPTVIDTVCARSSITASRGTSGKGALARFTTPHGR
jgi:hypothetical protein